MGNNQSNARATEDEHRHAQAHVPAHADQEPHEPHQHNPPPNHESRARIAGSRTSVFSSARHSVLTDSWRMESQRIDNENDTAFDHLDNAIYDPDERPLFHTHDPPVEPHPDRPNNWRHSTMSRLGSRLLPDPVARGLTNSGEETAEEGQALRGFPARSRSSVYHRRIASSSHDRFQMATGLRRRTTTSETQRPNAQGSIRRFLTSASLSQPVQLRSNDDNYEEGHEAERSLEYNARSPLSSNTLATFEPPPISRSRFSRVRTSLSSPFSTFFGSDRVSSRRMQSPPLRPLRTSLADDVDELLPQPRLPDQNGEMDNHSLHELDATEPETRSTSTGSRITSGMSTIRRFPQGLRSRSTRLIRRGEHPPLSQVLQLAAAAIAAQLSGSSINVNEASGSPSDAFDGSIQNFVQTLQEAASAQAGQNIDLNAPEGELPPVNFMRVFQFPNDENGTPLAARANQHSPIESADGTTHENADRSVTLVLVGVRSMPNISNGHTNENGTLSPSLDTLLSLPFLPPANVLRNGSSGALFRRSDTRVRSQTRRNSMTNFSFPQQYETQRHTRTRTSVTGRTSTENGLLTPMSESPPGPNPPPSTPADLRSGHATPIRRPSSASAVHSSGLANLEESQDNPAALPPTDSALNAARQRLRSDSEFARRPELSSGNSRRNGVVEPDRSSGSVGRSWLIYVVGTNVSPDHPAFTMPSLFTDNPSYEDMQMLSTLLGPVKPPVASRDEVEAAGGLYRILPRGATLVAESINTTNDHIIAINAGDRCLICLSEYEDGDHARRITSCEHLFHRECIDEWLTTGRNSCPMCRGQGVKETSAGSASNNSHRPEEAEI